MGVSGYTCSGGTLPRETILAKWLRHFSNLAVRETAAPAGFIAGERLRGQECPCC
jgi:hypothetical protein